MSNLKLQRHIGRLTNTGSTVVVIMNQIEGKEDHALVVESDTLPPKFRDEFADMINSQDAQQTPDLANLLHRRIFGSTGRSMLSDLHNEGHLRTEPITNVTMLVTKKDVMPLVDIVNAIRLQTGKNPIKKAEDQKTVPQEQLKTNEENSQSVSLDQVPSESPKGISDEDQAKNLLAQAQLLESDVQKLREQAYGLDPSLKPKRGRPKNKK